MIREFRISLVCVLVIQAFSAHSQSSDVKVDSSLVLSPYLFKSDLFQQPAVMLFDNFSPRGFIRYKKAYRDTAIIRTSLYYELGLRKYQDLRIDHVQRLNETTNLVLDYNRNTYTGIYQDEGFSRDRLFFGVQGVKKKWHYDAFLNYYNLNRALNGGLIYDTLFTDTILGRQFLPVINEGATTRLKTVGWKANIWHELGQDSSLQLGLNVNGQREFYTYSDAFFTDSAGVSESFYLDSNKSSDGYIEGFETYALGLRKTFKHTSYGIALGYMGSYYRNFGIKQSFNPFASYQIRHTGRIGVQHEFMYVPGKLARLSTLVNLDWKLDSSNTVLLRGQLYSGPASAFYDNYVSNRIMRHTNNIANSIGYGQAELTYSNTPFHLEIGYKLEMGRDLPVLDIVTETYAPVDVIAHYVTVAKHIYIGKGWLLTGTYEFFNGSEAYYRYPVHRIGGGIKRSGSFFKGKMKCWIQARYRYTPSFKQYSVFEYTYDLIPSNSSIPSYSYFDIRTGATIGNVDLFLNAYNASEGLLGYTYFDFPHYPGKDRLITFGVLLKFND